MDVTFRMGEGIANASLSSEMDDMGNPMHFQLLEDLVLIDDVAVGNGDLRVVKDLGSLFFELRKIVGIEIIAAKDCISPSF